MQKTILITGATSGFGKACAERGFQRDFHHRAKAGFPFARRQFLARQDMVRDGQHRQRLAAMAGGQGAIAGTIIGAFIIGIINNGLNLLDMPSAYHPIATGIVILVALILNQGVSLPAVFKKLVSRPAG